VGGKIYAIGGASSSGASLNVVEAYTPGPRSTGYILFKNWTLYGGGPGALATRGHLLDLGSRWDNCRCDHGGCGSCEWHNFSLLDRKRKMTPRAFEKFVSRTDLFPPNRTGRLLFKHHDGTGTEEYRGRICWPSGRR